MGKHISIIVSSIFIYDLFKGGNLDNIFGLKICLEYLSLSSVIGNAYKSLLEDILGSGPIIIKYSSSVSEELMYWFIFDLNESFGNLKDSFGNFIYVFNFYY